MPHAFECCRSWVCVTNFGFCGCESIEASSRARILARTGVDYVAFGPNDLSFNLESHPQYPLQTVDACMRNVAEQLQGTEVRLGMAVTTTRDQRDPYLDMGIPVFQEAG